MSKETSRQAGILSADLSPIIVHIVRHPCLYILQYSVQYCTIVVQSSRWNPRIELETTQLATHQSLAQTSQT